MSNNRTFNTFEELMSALEKCGPYPTIITTDAKYEGIREKLGTNGGVTYLKRDNLVGFQCAYRDGKSLLEYSFQNDGGVVLPNVVSIEPSNEKTLVWVYKHLEIIKKKLDAESAVVNNLAGKVISNILSKKVEE